MSDVRQLSVALLSLWLVGCGNPSPFPMSAVRGTVTLDGEPLRAGSVVFRRFAEGENRNVGKAAYGEIDAKGRYVVGTYGRRDGAIVGAHYVMVNYVPDGADDGGRQLLKIGLEGRKFDVLPDQANVFDIDLTSDMVQKSIDRKARARNAPLE